MNLCSNQQSICYGNECRTNTHTSIVQRVWCLRFGLFIKTVFNELIAIVSAKNCFVRTSGAHYLSHFRKTQDSHRIVNQLNQHRRNGIANSQNVRSMNKCRSIQWIYVLSVRTGFLSNFLFVDEFLINFFGPLSRTTIGKRSAKVRQTHTCRSVADRFIRFCLNWSDRNSKSLTSILGCHRSLCVWFIHTFWLHWPSTLNIFNNNNNQKKLLFTMKCAQSAQYFTFACVCEQQQQPRTLLDIWLVYIFTRIFPFARSSFFHLQFIAFTQIERNFNNILLNTLKSIRRVNVQRLAVQPRYATDAIHSHHTGTHTQYAFDFYLKLLNLRRQLCFAQAQAISATCPVTSALGCCCCHFSADDFVSPSHVRRVNLCASQVNASSLNGKRWPCLRCLYFSSAHKLINFALRNGWEDHN